MIDERKRKAEWQLLESLRAHRAEMTDLLEECSGHWGWDDPVYRFYHQSFKVYWIQERTLRIVKALEQLMPERRLNAQFLEIVEEGTGKVFTMADNKDWTRITRPILEAYFHARFFLDVAIRSADIAEPPMPLPSGYAALLYLYDMRSCL